jgi:hypothetical protein
VFLLSFLRGQLDLYLRITGVEKYFVWLDIPTGQRFFVIAWVGDLGQPPI